MLAGILLRSLGIRTRLSVLLSLLGCPEGVYGNLFLEVRQYRRVGEGDLKDCKIHLNDKNYPDSLRLASYRNISVDGKLKTLVLEVDIEEFLEEDLASSAMPEIRAVGNAVIGVGPESSIGRQSWASTPGTPWSLIGHSGGL